jgi:Excalibur calcium-binding domain
MSWDLDHQLRETLAERQAKLHPSSVPPERLLRRACTQMHKRWQYGGSKSQRAARRQVQTGHYRPRVSRSGYRANRNLDADDDGTACEVCPCNSLHYRGR